MQENRNAKRITVKPNVIIFEDAIFFDSKKNKETYLHKGKWSKFFGRKNDSFGYKLFLKSPQQNVELRSADEENVIKIFKIQKILFEGGYSPKPYEIIKCFEEDPNTLDWFIIKMDHVKGPHIRPSEEWVDDFCLFCESNKLKRTESSIRAESTKPENCILADSGRIYMIDIDWKWRRANKYLDAFAVFEKAGKDLMERAMRGPE